MFNNLNFAIFKQTIKEYFKKIFLKFIAKRFTPSILTPQSSILHLICLSVFLLLTACATQDGPPDYYVDASNIPNAVPKVLPRSPYGNPSSYEVNGQWYHLRNSCYGYHERGIASWYGTKFNGERTSDGERYDMLGMTAASKVLPIPCFVRVTNLENGKTIIVKVNDRGPFAPNRIIDLSYAAAKKIGMTAKGTALVQVTSIDPRTYHAANSLSPVPMIKHPELYLQIGAFRDEQNAERLENNLKQFTSRSVLIEKGWSNGLPIYRVQVGPLKSVDETDYLKNLFESEKLGEAVTVIR